MKLAEQYEVTNDGKEQGFDITQALTIVFNDIQTNGIVPGTGFAYGWMCPLYKKRDKTKISNYRSITVLNTDYKIFTKALMIKLSEAIPKIIHLDQAGFMSSRQIKDQTELAQATIE